MSSGKCLKSVQSEHGLKIIFDKLNEIFEKIARRCVTTLFRNHKHMFVILHINKCLFNVDLFLVNDKIVYILQTERAFNCFYL